MDDDAGLTRTLRGLWLALALAAVADAALNRRKYGEVLGFVPYDFRLPTLARAKTRTWNPSSTRILTPTTFGVGWTVNLGRLARLAHLT